MLQLDALCGSPPTLLAILGTRTATWDPKPFYRARERVFKALRRRWPSADYASMVEFTTGHGPKSGGLRRPHWNLLIKGIPVDAVDEAREIIARVWCSHVDALPERQYVESIASPEKAIGYIAAHFQKESQKPPKGWSGQRFNRSRGYLWQPIDEARSLARSQMAADRELWKLEQDLLGHGIDLADLAEAADDLIAQARQHAEQKLARSWHLTKVAVTDQGTAFSAVSGQPVPDFTPGLAR